MIRCLCDLGASSAPSAVTRFFWRVSLRSTRPTGLYRWEGWHDVLGE